jgi:alpha-tubulin suppressor-like RCC1 family protein
VKAQIVPNLVIAPVGANGKVALYNGSGGTIQLIADVSGYYLAGAPVAAGAFGSLAPSRLLDTRDGTGVPVRAAVPAGGTVHLQVTGRGGVPSAGVSAVVLNVTVASPTKGGFVTVFGEGSARPTASNLNFVKAQVVPNLVIAPVGDNGRVALYNGSGGTIQLIADVAGYYLAGAPVDAGAFGSLAPSRLLDTRDGTGVPAKAAVPAGGTVHLQVTGRGGVPAAGVSGVVLNVTVASPTKGGFVTVFGDGTSPRPTASNLNFVKAQVVPNLVIAPVGDNGRVALYNGSGGTIQLIADESGYYSNTTTVPTTGPVTGVTGTPTTTSIVLSWSNPASASLTGVMIRRALGTTPPATPTSGTLVTDAAKPQTSFTDEALAPATTYSYALFAHDATAAYAVAAPVQVTTLAAPGPVTVHPAVPDHTWIDLSWTNPTEPSLNGVMIRRAQGTTPPASATGGTLVADVLAPVNTFTDTGLTPDTDYSYAFFAHDATHHDGLRFYSAARTLTTKTSITSIMVSAGTSHSCAVTTASGVKCWGLNVSGELGNGTTSQSPVPVNVSGLGAGAGVIAVSAGGSHTCAVTSTGVVRCWGANGSGELGNGTTVDSKVPVVVAGLNAVAVSAGSNYTCAVTSTGGVKCWGDNFYGVLGNNTTVSSSAPVDVSGLGSGAKAVSAGRYHACAVTTDGAVSCWGSNGDGQLGDGTNSDRLVPVAVSGLGAGSGAVAVSAGGYHSCAVTAVGGVECWGNNGSGELGNNTNESSLLPVEAFGLGFGSGAVTISTGLYHSCAVLLNGAAKCWGANFWGEVGNRSDDPAITPVDVFGLASGAGAIAVSAGDDQTCAVVTLGSAKDGAVKCWGSNSGGQLGDGSNVSSNVPVNVVGLR